MSDDWRAVLSGERDWAIVQGDCLDVLREMPEGCVDAVVTDPPYGVGFKYRDTEEHSTADGWWGWFEPHYREMERVTVPGGLIASWFSRTYLHRAWEWFGEDVRIFVEARNFVQMRPVAMQSAWQPVAMRWKVGATPKKPAARPCGFDWAVANSAVAVARPDLRLHPCPRQMDVMVAFVERFVPERGLILDPFCGSATTVLAAERRERRCIGIEREPEYVEIARRRIEEDMPLFNRRGG